MEQSSHSYILLINYLSVFCQNFLKSKYKFSISILYNLHKFLFIIYPSFLKIFSKIFKISTTFFQRLFLYFFFQTFNKHYSNLIFLYNFVIFSQQFLRYLLTFYQAFCKFLHFFFPKIYSESR